MLLILPFTNYCKYDSCRVLWKACRNIMVEVHSLPQICSIHKNKITLAYRVKITLCWQILICRLAIIINNNSVSVKKMWFFLHWKQLGDTFNYKILFLNYRLTLDQCSINTSVDSWSTLHWVSQQSLKSWWVGQHSVQYRLMVTWSRSIECQLSIDRDVDRG